MKIIYWNCRGLKNPTIVSELRQLITASVIDIIFLSETKLRVCDFDKIRRSYNMTSCFVVDAIRHKGGLAMMWTDDCYVDVQRFSLNHVDVLVKTKDMDHMRFTGFYGFSELN